MTGEILAQHEELYLRRWQIKQQLDALRGALLIPHEVIFELWDYKRGTWRRVRDRRGRLVLGAYARVDELAQELGFVDGEELKGQILSQLQVRSKIKSLQEELRSLTFDRPDQPAPIDSIPF